MLTLPQRDVIIWAPADSALNCGLLQCEALNLALCFHFDELFNPVRPFLCKRQRCLPGAVEAAPSPGGTWGPGLAHRQLGHRAEAGA